MEENFAYIGLGSNLDDPSLHVQQALDELTAHTQIELVACSEFYQTKPVGPQDQPDFINAACLLNTSLSALALLDEMQAIENRHGRVRKQRWGARTLDLDLLLYNDDIIDNERLTVPHPEISNRAFVLVPLADINQELHIPGLGQIHDLLENIDQSGINVVTHQ